MTYNAENHFTQPQTASDIRENTGKQIAAVARQWRTALDDRLRPTGLSQAKWLVLLDIKRQGEGRLQKELAKNLGVEGPTLVRTLDALEAIQLVQRRSRATDRRAKTVHLTKKAHALVAEVEQTAAHLREEILDDISPNDMEVFLQVLDRVSLNIKKLNKPGAE